MLRKAVGFTSLCLVLSVAFAADTSAEKPIKATDVTLNGPISLQDALKKLGASGNLVIDLRSKYGQEENNPTLQLALDKAPFWRAVDALTATANLRVRPWINPETKRAALGLLADHQPGKQQPKLLPAYDGPFRLSVKRLTAERNFDDDSLSNLSLAMELTWEPRLQPLLLKLKEDSVKTAGDQRALTAVDQGGSGVIRLLGEAAVELPLRLPLPDRGRKTLPKLECQFNILVPMERLQFDFKKIARGEKQSAKGVTVQINRFETEPNSGLWSIGLTLQYPPGALDLESHQTWALDSNELTLIDANGQRVTSKLNREVAIEDGGAMKVTYYFERMTGDPKDCRLEYRAPAAPLTYPAKFAFTDLPLP